MEYDIDRSEVETLYSHINLDLYHANSFTNNGP